MDDKIDASTAFDKYQKHKHIFYCLRGKFKFPYYGLDDYRNSVYGLKFETDGLHFGQVFMSQRTVLFSAKRKCYRLYYVPFTDIEKNLKSIEQHFENTYKLYIKNKVSPLIKNAVDSLNKLVSYRIELEQLLPLPIQYRDEKSIYCLMQLFYDGKVENMKEALNLLDTQKYREEVIEKLGNIENQFNYIKNIVTRTYLKVDYIHESLNKINENINTLYEQNEKLIKEVKYIKFNTFITAWNTLE